MSEAPDFLDVPVNRHLGMHLVRRDSSGAVVEVDRLGDFVQEQGIVHGGILSTLADTAAVHALLPELEPGGGMTSIEFKMNFLRPARPDGGTLVAQSHVVRKGRRIGSCEVEVTQADRVVAKGWFSYLFLAPEGR